MNAHAAEDCNRRHGWAYASVRIDAAGVRNILADEPVGGKMSWEQVAAANPDIILIYHYLILIYHYLDPSVESKIATLKGIPALADTTAVKKENFATIRLLTVRRIGEAYRGGRADHRAPYDRQATPHAVLSLPR